MKALTTTLLRLLRKRSHLGTWHPVGFAMREGRWFQLWGLRGPHICLQWYFKHCTFANVLNYFVSEVKQPLGLLGFNMWSRLLGHCNAGNYYTCPNGCVACQFEIPCVE